MPRSRGSAYRRPWDPSSERWAEWAPWVRDLRGLSGVYLIRDVASRVLLYIGESTTGRLYQTLTRHFQNWNGERSGMTYAREASEVRVLIVENPADAKPLQYALIRQLQPRDNLIDGRTLLDWLDDVPF